MVALAYSESIDGSLTMRSDEGSYLRRRNHIDGNEIRATAGIMSGCSSTISARGSIASLFVTLAPASYMEEP